LIRHSDFVIRDCAPLAEPVGLPSRLLECRLKQVRTARPDLGWPTDVQWNYRFFTFGPNADNRLVRGRESHIEVRTGRPDLLPRKGRSAVRWSKTFIPTLKETPADAEVPSHRLMLRAGLIRQLMAGAYTYLPLGWRAVRKAEAIVREEMEAAGAIEIFMPALQPIELFERTGRRRAFGNVLINFKVRRRDHEVHLALGPTHEEVVTDLVAHFISSYRQLPLTLFQIQTKFRNEERPRFGVLRTSEFLMKDAYSFDTSLEQLNDSYDAMYRAYCRIFARCGLEFFPVEAESGPIGGDASHEFMVPAANGEDRIVRCSGCGYAANLERAETGRKSPLAGQGGGPEDAGPLAQRATVDTPAATSIEQVSKLLGVTPRRMIKTLIYMADGKPVAVLVRGDHDANEGKIRRALEATTVGLADEETIRRVSGAPVGFAGPVGIHCELVADHDVPLIRDAVTGANEADKHHTGVNCGRDYRVATTFDLRDAAAGDPCPRCDGTLDAVHGIEVGHVFKLGTKYSISLGAEFLDEKEQRHPIIMGCYGIGVNRIIAAAAETSFDDNGLIWPLAIAPYSVLVIPLNMDDAEVLGTADRIYEELSTAGVDVLYDDRAARPGFKFKDADLIGVPLRIVVGAKGLKDGVVEMKWRTDASPDRITIPDAVSEALNRLQARRNQEQSAAEAWPA
jgi:prolyl-tRNA synthetase